MKRGLPADLHGVVCLDLFAGVGGLGIEALSRGAERVVFVEKDRRHGAVLRENLRELGAEGLAAVIRSSVEDGRNWRGLGPFDLVFSDPPYALGVEAQVMELLLGTLSPGALVVMEHDPGLKITAVPGLEAHSSRKLGPAGLTVFVHQS